MQWYLMVLKNFTDFKCRSRRKEFWCFNLINMIILLTLQVLDIRLGLVDLSKGFDFGVISRFYLILVFIPSLAVEIRRLHDIGRSGYWVLLSLLPFTNIYLLIILTMDSVQGTNQYGPSPKEYLVDTATYKCADCGHLMPGEQVVWKYCPRCGGEMRPEQELE